MVVAYNYGGGFLGAANLGNNTYSTQVLSTSLADSKELKEILPWRPTAANISNATSGAAYDEARSLLPPVQVATDSRKPLLDMMEELFFNITISMASSEALLYNHSSPFAPPPANVTYHLYGNVYTYDPQKLCLAYGIALGVSLLNVICGLWAMLSTGASFSADFSSVARIVQNAAVDVDMREELAGRDPLPKHMARATLTLGGGGGGRGGGGKKTSNAKIDGMVYNGVRR